MGMAVVLLLVGCTSSDEKILSDTFSKQRAYHKNLGKTEKVQLYTAQGTKALFTGTYLYTQTSDKKDEKDEVFILGLYSEDNTQNDLASDAYVLTLNSQSPKKIERLGHSDPRLKDISFVTEWGDYYLVTFPHVSGKSLDLLFESKAYGKGILHFAKVAKYILTDKLY